MKKKTTQTPTTLYTNAKENVKREIGVMRMTEVAAPPSKYVFICTFSL